MANSVTPNAIATLLSAPKSESMPHPQQIVVQITNLEPKGKSYGFDANDGNMKMKAIFNSRLSTDVISGKIQNLALLRVLDYSVNEIPSKAEKYLIITRCEPVSLALEQEIQTRMKKEETLHLLKPKQENQSSSDMKCESPGIILQPKQEPLAKSISQIAYEQHGNMPPSARMAMTRRVHPLISLNPYQGNWTIKVRVTSKGNMRTYKNARGEGCVFNVELTDSDGTEIQATMFNEAARKFYDKFQLGKMYYISKGALKVANKIFRTVKNDYEMTLNDNSEVEEVSNEATLIPEARFHFVPIVELVSHVSSKSLIDVIGIVQSVSPTMSIRRKIDNESIPKRDITIADETRKTVTVTLWNELATVVGQELLDMVDKAPIIAIKSIRVADFQGISLSTVAKSTIQINPEIPESKKLRYWYDSEGREASMASVGSGLSPLSMNGMRSMYSDRILLSEITSNPSMGSEKSVFFSIKASITYIRSDQTMWYRACKTCNKKVTDSIEGGYWCEGCQKNDADCSLRYIMVVKISDASSESWVSAFNDEAHKIIGCSADELDSLKSQGDGDLYLQRLKKATWNLHLFRVGVSQNEFNGEKRQRITVKAVAPVDFTAESRFLLEEISKSKNVS